MCFVKTPKVQKPEPVAEPPRAQDPAVKDARKRTKEQAIAARGFAGASAGGMLRPLSTTN